MALAVGDPAALTVVVRILLGSAPGKMVELRCRDVDANGSILWID